ncbi:hypothetical protein Fmac_001672 [Flemingia macrophylla]|uniref:Secreted protein n=1 Tax=Flemingia macrophylla TaxID=520843 RepID=A0ABD1NJ30_9FABA
MRVATWSCCRVCGFGAIWLGKVALMVEVLDIVHQLLLVAVEVVDGAVEFEELHWDDWRIGLQDIVPSWHYDHNLVTLSQLLSRGWFDGVVQEH